MGIRRTFGSLATAALIVTSPAKAQTTQPDAVPVLDMNQIGGILTLSAAIIEKVQETGGQPTLASNIPTLRDIVIHNCKENIRYYGGELAISLSANKVEATMEGARRVFEGTLRVGIAAKACVAEFNGRVGSEEQISALAEKAEGAMRRWVAFPTGLPKQPEAPQRKVRGWDI